MDGYKLGNLQQTLSSLTVYIRTWLFSSKYYYESITASMR